jgi:hypothetical protein
VLDLSRYELESLRTEGDLILYRGRGQGAHSQILVLSSVGQHPSSESLKRLDNEFSVKDELDPSWAAQPLGQATYWGRTVLVLRDPGGVPLESAFGTRLAASSAGAGAREPPGRGTNGSDLAFCLRIAALQEAVGSNGRLIVDLVPELELIIGQQPVIPDLPSQDAKARFQLVFRRFVAVFARADHPLALFVVSRGELSQFRSRRRQLVLGPESHKS